MSCVFRERVFVYWGDERSAEVKGLRERKLHICRSESLCSNSLALGKGKIQKACLRCGCHDFPRHEGIWFVRPSMKFDD